MSGKPHERTGPPAKPVELPPKAAQKSGEGLHSAMEELRRQRGQSLNGHEEAPAPPADLPA